MIVCTRRRALWMGGAFAASGPLASLAQALPRNEGAPARGTRMYAALRGATEADTGVAAFDWTGAAWRQRQFFAAPGAGPLLASHDETQIFVTHAAKDGRDVAGFVETLHVDARTGLLLRGRQESLALSARVPTGVALAPDGRMLAVAAAGGVLSLLPVQANGHVAEVTAAHKHLALAHSAAAMASMVFAASCDLHVHCLAQGLRFHCGQEGFRYMGVSDVRPLQAAHAAHTVPLGVVSSVLLPPLSV